MVKSLRLSTMNMYWEVEVKFHILISALEMSNELHTLEPITQEVGGPCI